MKATLSWLKEFVDITCTPQELADSLTMAGLEVESCEKLERRFSGIVAGRILSCVPHPKSDHLTVCQVDAGRGVFQIVCGAPNAVAGLTAPLALLGAKIADGTTMEKREIRGMESYGMLCSEAELQLSERADGIMILPDDVKPGSDLLKIVGEEDYVFDVFITPNRPDCLSIIGLAREISAITGKPLRCPKPRLPKPVANKKSKMKIKIQNPEHCQRYSGRLLENLVMRPAPFWMAYRLYASGMRAINNIVDVTNYVMLETGHPLHAFDWRLLDKQEIRVRTAKPDEKFTTLDGQEHQLDDEMCLICDGVKAVALAGVMGGQNSEVQPDTQTVYLESAYFEPTSIRRTSKKLGLSTESSRRFERGANPNGTLFALNRATELLVELADAALVDAVNDDYPVKIKPVKIPVSVKKINRLLGTAISKKKMCSILAPLDITISRQQGDRLDLSIPTFRPDLTRQIDIVEEIGRLYGYEHIPEAQTARINQQQQANERIAFNDHLRSILSGIGLKETVSLSLVTPQSAKMFLPVDATMVELLNPLSAELSVFRPNLLISILSSAAYNRNRQNSNLRLFEIGNVAWKTGNDYIEKKQVVILLAGKRQEQTWYAKEEQFDFYDMKGLATALLEKLGISNLRYGVQNGACWDGDGMAVKIGDSALGAFGKISREVCEEYKIKTQDVFAFIMDFDALYQAFTVKRSFEPVPRFPSVPFDLAVLADVNTPVADIETAIRQAGGPHLRSVHLFDFYKGEQVPDGKKSLAFSLTFISKERTLDVNEVEQWVKAILTHLKDHLAVDLRPR